MFIKTCMFNKASQSSARMIPLFPGLTIVLQFYFLKPLQFSIFEFRSFTLINPLHFKQKAFSVHGDRDLEVVTLPARLQD